MCTIAALRGVHPGFPLIVAANRDEFYARAATAPEHRGRTRAGASFWAGRDVKEGGTWMGVTAAGFFVGITNQRSAAPRAPGRRSRGEVVLEALEAGTTAGVEALLSRRDPADYNPFNLLFGDARALRVAYARDAPASMTVHALPEGVHVLANDRLGSPLFPKTARAERLLDVATLASLDEAALRARLTAVLADGEVPAASPEPTAGSLIPAEFARRLQALCVRTPVYGTVSATVLLLGDGAVRGYWYADGAPDVTALREVRRAPTAE